MEVRGCEVAAAMRCVEAACTADGECQRQQWRRRVLVHNDVPYTNAMLLRAFRRQWRWQVVTPDTAVGDDAVVDGGARGDNCVSHDVAATAAGDGGDDDGRPGCFDVQVDEYECLRWGDVLKGRLVASCYCVRKGLIRKANFAYHVNKVVGKAATRTAAVLRECVPQTLVLETWEAFQPPSDRMFAHIDRCVSSCRRVVVLSCRRVVVLVHTDCMCVDVHACSNASHCLEHRDASLHTAAASPFCFRRASHCSGL
jgi:hypothetical protein